MKCKFCTKECKNSNSLRNHERLCKLNPNRQKTSCEDPEWQLRYNKGHKGSNQFIKAYRLGLPKPEISEETRRRISERVKANNPMHKEQCRKKVANTMKRIYSVNPPKVAGRSKQGSYKGFYCRSSWELAYVIYNLEHNVNFIANTKGFPYIWENEYHTYFPDFYLPDSNTYIEVKGYYDKRAQEKSRQFQGNLIVMQLKELKPYLDYCIEKYGDDFIKLYERNEK